MRPFDSHTQTILFTGRRLSYFALWVVFLACASDALSAKEKPTIVLFPTQISLPTNQARQLLVVQSKRGDRLLGQVHEKIALSSSDLKVVRIEEGVAIPVSNGRATITAKVGAAVATSQVTVSGQEKPFVWNFRNHVESVFSKAGCNGGACHGARAGKNGFRLTLFGYEPFVDYSYLTRQARGRRIVPSDPGRSLLLTKPTGLIPHKGGVRFDPQSVEYRVLAEWIAQGTPAPRKDDPRIERLEVLPKNSRQKPGNHQQLVVRAHFNNGHVEDVTRWAKYTSVNENVASVGKHGRVAVTGSGEGAVKVWYLNLNAMAFMSVPYPHEIAAEVFAKSPRNNFIDRLILEKLQSLNIPPSPSCDDATFIRRAYLDTMGVLPTAEEVRKFLADKTVDKRNRLIDHLLIRPEMVDYWAYKWSDLLLVSGSRLRPKAVESYYAWIRKNVADNTPWDEFARQIVTARGSTFENGAANFFALHQDPEDMSETVSQAFLGLAVVCARCHNHPLEKWSNDQYYGMANMFSRVRGKGWGGDFRSGDGKRVIFSDIRGELLQPSMGRPQPPRPLDGETVPFEATGDRRIELAKWMTAPENPYFTRTIVNRVWANYFGVGLVEKVDDMRLTNPASNEKLLSAATDFLVAEKFNLKSLMRAVMQSAAYQRSSIPLADNRADNRFYSRYYPRRMKAEVMLDAVSQVTGVPTTFKDKKQGTRALELPDSSVQSYFLSTFGRPDRLITCECERSDEPSMTQVLHIYNGKTLNDKLQAKESRVAKLLTAKTADEKIIEELYLSALSRRPSKPEAAKLAAVLSEVDAQERRQVLEDLYWSVLSSREFLFNH